ncbi:MAG TPA: HNH endonuclease family protein [Candidatus Corynebacterium gallistercoris]|uniref:HNH endonuclease family protein n=1 Tax=Candidatus Corynebacterium gallistercoris TaxID=2838530 RepID=A0A9D1RVD5_9CORY|nr:HNH endonuclease family protein [Candidatus Corynebacterium gallistercoris]
MAVALVVFIATPPHAPINPTHARAVTDALATLERVPMRVRVPGYSRDQFGQGWGTVYIDHMACTTRQHALRLTFEPDAQEEAGRARGGVAPQCTTNGTTATDPYTGTTMSAAEVDVDHVVPLAAAWDLGAWAWPPRRRWEFANDLERNLIVTDAGVNREKSDSTLAEWMPAIARCGYAAKFLGVLVAYELPVTEADASAGAKACRVRAG